MVEEQSKVVIIGVGDDGWAGLTELARSILQDATLILGPQAVLSLLPELPGNRTDLEAEMGLATQQVRDAMSDDRAVLVTSGDPLFYGIARYLCDRLGKESFEIIPHVSSMQLAFARVKESWDDAYLADLGGHSLESILNKLRHAEKIGLFSSDRCPPSRLARAMLDRGLEHYRAYVCEHLGSPDERVTQATLKDLIQLDFDPLHVLILVRETEQPERPERDAPRLRFGNPDSLFNQSQPRKSLVTTAEVRAIALAQLAIGEEAIVWDVGAGSGSVAIEAARLATKGRVFAIEPRTAELSMIQSNADRFGVSNVELIAGRAPDALVGIPDPDAVFVGGTGRHVGAILKSVFERLRPGGRLAVNVATIEGFLEAHKILKQVAREVQSWNVQIARSIEQLDRIRFQPLNQTFLLAVSKSD